MRIGAIIFICFFCACKAKSQFNNCNGFYDSADVEITAYRNTVDKQHLQSAQLYLDSAMSCSSIRRKVIERKIQLFSMQENYIKAANFIAELQTKDFDFSYQKNMYESYFKGKYYESIHEYTKKDSIFNNSIKEIQNFINKANYKDLQAGSIPYYNLFFTKSRVYDSSRINKELDSLTKKYPNDNILIEEIRTITLGSID